MLSVRRGGPTTRCLCKRPAHCDTSLLSDSDSSAATNDVSPPAPAVCNSKHIHKYASLLVIYRFVLRFGCLPYASEQRTEFETNRDETLHELQYPNCPGIGGGYEKKIMVTMVMVVMVASYLRRISLC